jgi:hypothetical protein
VRGEEAEKECERRAGVYTDIESNRSVAEGYGEPQHAARSVNDGKCVFVYS